MPIAGKKCFGVACPCEDLAESLKFRPNVEMIVDFSIVDDDVPVDRIDHGLIARRRRIENSKPSHSHPHATIGRSPFASGIRPAMFDQAKIEPLSIPFE